ncbi:MAG: hypothetical protein JXR94_10970 [Candidatus Hydrogenedentes bacterium]|nr:hypothetical protein [Candidatus Hydrogenedentota bacterium]
MWQYVAPIRRYVQCVFLEESVPGDPPGTDPDRCTIENLLNYLRSGIGIVNYHAHGGGDFVAVDTWGPGPENKAARDRKLAEYKATYGAANCSAWNFRDRDDALNYGIRVYAPLVKATCAERIGGPQGVSFIGGCEYGDMGLNAFYSQVSFGYAGIAYSPGPTREDIEGIFSRMNGAVGNGQYRSAIDAYADYDDPDEPGGDDYVEIYIAEGEVGNLELSPTVSDACPVNGDEDNYARAGEARIQFSSPMKTSIPAASLISLSGASFAVEPTWELGGKGIRFDYAAEDEGWITITVSGSAEAKMQRGDIYLDGNDGDPDGHKGVAPNQDDFAFRFYGN